MNIATYVSEGVCKQLISEMTTSGSVNRGSRRDQPNRLSSSLFLSQPLRSPNPHVHLIKLGFCSTDLRAIYHYCSKPGLMAESQDSRVSITTHFYPLNNILLIDYIAIGTILGQIWAGNRNRLVWFGTPLIQTQNMDGSDEANENIIGGGNLRASFCHHRLLIAGRGLDFVPSFLQELAK